MEAKFKVGDKVKIKLSLVNDEFKKYNKVYTIKKVRKTNNNEFIYILNGVPKCGTEEMIELV